MTPRQAPLPRLVLSFSKVKYATNPVTVTSLIAKDPQGPIKVTRCDNAPGQSGPLQIEYVPQDEVAETNVLGSAVVKRLESGRQFVGNVLEGLQIVDDTIQITADKSRYLVPGDVNSPLVYQGVAKIRAIVEPADRTIAPQLVQLQDSVQRPDLLTLGFPPSINSHVIYKFVLPGPSRFPPNPRAMLKLWLTGTLGTPLPGLSVAYRRIPTPVGVSIIPSSPTSLTTPTMPTTDAAHYAEVSWPVFAVAAGDVVVIDVLRSGASDGYSGEVGIMNASLVISATP